MHFRLRFATPKDIPELNELIEASVRTLQAGDYTTAQMDGALGTVLGVDTQLIEDQTYHVLEAHDWVANTSPRIVGCGGWSKRKTLFGADAGPGRAPELLNPAVDAAKIRAIFIHPEFARQGLGSFILEHVESEAKSAGFVRFEMGSTLTGVQLYRRKGYVEVEEIAVPLKNGEVLRVVKMAKTPPSA